MVEPEVAKSGCVKFNAASKIALFIHTYLPVFENFTNGDADELGVPISDRGDKVPSAPYANL